MTADPWDWVRTRAIDEGILEERERVLAIIDEWEVVGGDPAIRLCKLQLLTDLRRRIEDR
jgi:hypothetical protein